MDEDKQIKELISEKKALMKLVENLQWVVNDISSIIDDYNRR